MNMCFPIGDGGLALLCFLARAPRRSIKIPKLASSLPLYFGLLQGLFSLDSDYNVKTSHGSWV